MEKERKKNCLTNFIKENDTHSEKVRRIIEQKPTFIVRWGNTVLLAVVLSALLMAWAAGMLNGR
ncbi:hypothetical protein [Bacteroides sp.]|uniref:hypothetical protein n=1 Tax=Bacteroides sp. TaxID=29523 RepID=UPI0023D5E53B|nr:hypothetical protein [Bacteroides sp.]MDE5711155.1 hypothetical protein [Bacteroides sp.]MDE5761572.1 hypothetical protein [Bacteroides sp.]MDE6216414.1 hypothetical protein [Bacteroides sp.]